MQTAALVDHLHSRPYKATQVAAVGSAVASAVAAAELVQQGRQQEPQVRHPFIQDSRMGLWLPVEARADQVHHPPFTRPNTVVVAARQQRTQEA